MTAKSGSDATQQTTEVDLSSEKRFPSPFELPAPEGAEGWQELYPYYYLFSSERRDMEDGKFWFFDGMHNPEPLYPFDTIMTENWWVAASQMASRVWPIPVAMGIDQRLVNGYIYISPNGVTDAEKIAERNVHFTRRAGHYFENWDEIYGEWEEKARDCIARIKEIEFRPLPELDPEENVFSHRGVYSSHDLLSTYNRLIENMLEMGSYHFEMLNLGYGAYLTFREFCQQAFPGMTDRTLTQMVCGIDNLLMRPDDELRKLAALAVEMKLADIVLGHDDPDEMLAAMAEAATNEFGGVNILVNNAGIAIRKAPQDYTLEEWEQVVDTNLTGTFLCARQVYPLMKDAGGGKIINIGSMTSIFGSDWVAAYSSSKGGVVQLTKSLALSWAADNIQVNSILPGWIHTDLTNPIRSDNPERYASITARIPHGRWGEPDEMRGCAIFLASAASDYVTGTAIPVDGGYAAF